MPNKEILTEIQIHVNKILELIDDTNYIIIGIDVYALRELVSRLYDYGFVDHND